MRSTIALDEEIIRAIAKPLRSDRDLDAIIDAVGEARVVLLGEASHGTSEFYTMRAAITRRLLTEKGFSFIAVEGDWPACYELNRFVKGMPGTPERAEEALRAFRRWPSWMWANSEIAALAEWLRGFNAGKPERERCGFYGLDVYSLWESLDEIMGYLERTGSPELEQAREAWNCFSTYRNDVQTYAISAAYLSESCRDEVVQLLMSLRARDESPSRERDGDEGRLAAELNALVAVNAEHYYRTMVMGHAESWNVRDRHMMEVLDRLMAFHGEGAKAIVWEHNTHIGDARATDMAEEGMVNVGQLARERFGRHDVFALGFGTYEGTVIAGRAWGEPERVMEVPPAMRGSWEHLLHRTGIGDQLLILRDADLSEVNGGEPIGHRAIGVVYNPRFESGNYVPSVMTERYDAFLHIERTRALTPLHAVREEPAPAAVEETLERE